MQCSCDYELPTMFNEKWRRARKEHKCCECRNLISAGSNYQNIVGVWSGDFNAYKTCEKCADLRDSLRDVSCHAFGNLQEDYFNYLDYSIDRIERDRVFYSVFPKKC